MLHTWLDEQRRVQVVTDDEPPRISVPVFGPQAMTQVAPVCDAVARRIADWLQADTRCWSRYWQPVHSHTTRRP